MPLGIAAPMGRVQGAFGVTPDTRQARQQSSVDPGYPRIFEAFPAPGFLVVKGVGATHSLPLP